MSVSLTARIMIGLLVCSLASAQSTSDIANQAQNPSASLIAVPLKNNTTFAVGEHAATANALEIEPVIPLTLSPGWNLITRTIVPVIEEAALTPGLGSESGPGDARLCLYLSPAQPTHGVIWGLGPSFSFATATDRSLGSGKDSLGLSIAFLTIQGPWLIGSLITDVASVGGREDRKNVHQFLIQPFVDDNFSAAWHLASSPIITADWKASSGNKWTVPRGGSVGKILRIGKQAVNA